MEIRLVKKEEVGLLQDFLKKHWREDHPLVKSRSLLDFQYLDGTHYNFNAAFDNGKIIAVCGFIPTSQYDSDLKAEGEMWGALWKVINNGTGYGGVGLEIQDQLVFADSTKTFSGIGLSKYSSSLNRIYYKMKMGYLRQYYIANRDIGKFTIAHQPHVDKSLHEKNSNVSININIDVEKLDNSPTCDYRPKKTLTYLKQRYKYHPIYKYQFWGIYYHDVLTSIWVIRRITIENASFFRCVDILGNIEQLPDMTENFQNILANETCEFIDCFNYGISSDSFVKMGFVEHDTESADTIIPVYMEPYEKKNVRIAVGYRSKNDKFVAFKGDSDQDRPNIL